MKFVSRAKIQLPSRSLTWALLLGLWLLPSGSGLAANLAWLNYEQGVSQARKRHKPLMIQVYADWCQECHQLSRDLQAHTELSHLLQREFVISRINLGSERKLSYQGSEISEKELATRLQATWPPMLLFYTADGRLIGRKFGYAPPDQLLQLLKNVAKQPKS